MATLDVKVREGVRKVVQQAHRVVPSWVPKHGGQQSITGRLNGQPYEFVATHGRGSCATDNHYLYFEHGQRWWYLPTGEQWPAKPDVAVLP